MSVVLRSIEIETVAYIRAPAGPVPRAETATAGVVRNIARYRTIGSLQALSLAATASVVTIALFLWAV
ncbi:hypothetical protein ASF53_13865 [Methylobacterium sp. Leaf123]|uniref:hypothetical protein n=1 Tax=Methylobacterium sp. Leaf123 TaxID=1736264 RepID=UPI0006FBD6DF|nr:hypothetical protein [Methylobacterium sp. Leaf123]KQQ13259.1 hypothetical protein ASF53_13865 [Methylobacterium sp. Leaf123]